MDATSSLESAGAGDDSHASLPRVSLAAPARQAVVVPVLTPVPSPEPVQLPEPAPATTSMPPTTTPPLLPPSPATMPPVSTPMPAAAAPTSLADAPSVDTTPREPKVTRRIDPAELEPGPVVAQELWVREPEVQLWETSHTLITGKRPIAQPHGRPLPRPRRFHAPVPWRSAVVLGIVLIIAGALAIGAVQAAHLSTQLLGTPHLPPTPHVTPTVPLHGTPGLHH